MRLTNQSAVFQISTNQKAVFGSRDSFDRVGIFEVWDRVWVKSRAANLATRLNGNDVRAEMTSAEMTTETGSEFKTSFISHQGVLGGVGGVGPVCG